MAEIQDNGGGKKGKGSKQKKMTVRVDFTPMVDMNMLLITCQAPDESSSSAMLSTGTAPPDEVPARSSTKRRADTSDNDEGPSKKPKVSSATSPPKISELQGGELTPKTQDDEQHYALRYRWTLQAPRKRLDYGWLYFIQRWCLSSVTYCFPHYTASRLFLELVLDIVRQFFYVYLRYLGSEPR